MNIKVGDVVVINTTYGFQAVTVLAMTPQKIEFIQPLLGIRSKGYKRDILGVSKFSEAYTDKGLKASVNIYNHALRQARQQHEDRVASLLEKNDEVVV